MLRDTRDYKRKDKHYPDNCKYICLSAMKYPEYEEAFSPARLNRYLKACGNDTSAALALYRYNILLCEKYYAVLNVFEVVLRNAINNHYSVLLSDKDWIRHQLDSGGILANYPHLSSLNNILENLDSTGRYTNDRVVASVSFGFWTHLFSRKPFVQGQQSLLQIFPERTKGLGQRFIYNELQDIKTLRNRIAHHEAICFDHTGAKSTVPAKNYYNLIIKYIRFLGYSESQLLSGLWYSPSAILQRIDTLR